MSVFHVSGAVLGMKGFKKFFLSKIVKNYEHFQEKEKKMFANSKFYEQNCSQFNYWIHLMFNLRSEFFQFEIIFWKWARIAINDFSILSFYADCYTLFENI